MWSSTDFNKRMWKKLYNTWEELEDGIKECKKCKLHSARNNIVFGVRKKRC